MGYKYNHSEKDLKRAVVNSSSIFGVLRELNIPVSGGMHSFIKTKIKKLGLDTSHFTGQGWTKGKKSNNRKTWKELLINRSDHENKRRQNAARLRRALIESGIEYKCKCGLSGAWQNIKLTLEINHKNGNFLDDRRENLEFLCPNCHSQIPNHAGVAQW